MGRGKKNHRFHHQDHLVEPARTSIYFYLTLLLEAPRQPRSQGLASLPPSVVGRETLVAAGHVTIYPSKTAGWVGTQEHLVERTIKYHPGEGEVEQLLVSKWRSSF